MSKVLVDRELLGRVLDPETGEEWSKACRELRGVLVRPAKAEGAEAAPADETEQNWEFFQAVTNYMAEHGLLQIAHEGGEREAALNVVASIERLRKEIASLRGSCKALGAENKHLHRTVKKQARMLTGQAVITGESQ